MEVLSQYRFGQLLAETQYTQSYLVHILIKTNVHGTDFEESMLAVELLQRTFPSRLGAKDIEIQIDELSCFSVMLSDTHMLSH